MKVYQVASIDDRLTEAFARLMPQLSATLPVPTAEELRRMVVSPAAALFCAEEQGGIIGVLSLAWYDVPSGRKAWIEDVVVDAACRGCGAGRALVDAACRHAAGIGASCVMLTSNPSRTAAHMLYRNAGFCAYDTTVFRLKM